MGEIIPEDAPAMLELHSDPEVHTYLRGKLFTTLPEIEKLIDGVREAYIKKGIGRFAVIEKQSGYFIGWSGLILVLDTVNGVTNFYDVGYGYIKRYWGKGYATEAAIASVRYGFEHMKLKEIFADADSRNTASRNVLQKAGLRYINSFDDEGCKTDWFRITHQEWLNKKA